ncbi:MAG: hypothetical protein HY909_01475 [Deltaproteobacteria bacterium]|nr:hypothetical protein [Deltaproteobacteria bacterium]
MALRFLLCAEDLLSATLARDLCDRVVHERARSDWLRALWAPEARDAQRTWTGLRPDVWWADRGSVEREARARRLRPHVRLRETGRLYSPRGVASEAFLALRVAATLDPTPALVVLSGDTDGETDPSRLRGAGVALAAEGLAVVLAEPCREAEAWVLAGFVPKNSIEIARLKALHRELGFDPTEAPERLMSDRTGDPRDAKRVLRALLSGGEPCSALDERGRQCWLDTPLELLASRGEAAGLGAFLRAVEAVLLPRLGDAVTPA